LHTAFKVLWILTAVLNLVATVSFLLSITIINTGIGLAGVVIFLYIWIPAVAIFITLVLLFVFSARGWLSKKPKLKVGILIPIIILSISSSVILIREARIATWF